jgi:hypothetical protein
VQSSCLLVSHQTPHLEALLVVMWAQVALLARHAASARHEGVVIALAGAYNVLDEMTEQVCASLYLS